MSSNEHKTLKTTMAITVVILLSKGAGLIRDMISAGYFATGMERDAYTSAYTLFYFPVLLFNSCITSTLIPLYVDARDNVGRRVANRFASNCINLFAVLGIAVSLLMMALAGPLVSVIFAGFAPEKQLLTTQLTQIMLPSLVFVVLSIVMASVLNANERYLSAQLTGFPLTVGVLIATVCFSPQYGIRAVSWGVFVAGVLQMLILVPSLSKSMRYTMRFNLGDKRFRRLMLLAVPAMLSMAVNELNHMVDKSLVSFLNEGDASAIDYAYRLITFATGVLAVPVTTIMFSRLAKRASQGDRQGIKDILNQSVEVLSLILLPITAIGCVLSTDIIRLVYGHGHFGADSVRVTSGVFFFYLVGVLGFGLRDVFNRAFHAMQDTRTPMLAACVTVVLNVVLNLTLSRVMGANGLALATSLSCALGAVLLVILLKKKVKHFGFSSTFDQLLRMGVGTALSLLAALALNRFVPGAEGKLMIFLRIALVTGVALGAYLAALAVLKVRQLDFLKSLVRRKQK